MPVGMFVCMCIHVCPVSRMRLVCANSSMDLSSLFVLGLRGMYTYADNFIGMSSKCAYVHACISPRLFNLYLYAYVHEYDMYIYIYIYIYTYV